MANPFKSLVKTANIPFNFKLWRNLGLLIAGVAGTGAILYSSVYNVEGGHKAILFSRYSGVCNDIYGEGINFKIPWLQIPIIYNVRTRATEIPFLTGSKDLQLVNLRVRILSKPMVSKLPIIYERLGLDFDARVFPSILNEVAKTVVARFNAAELITQRESVSKLIQDELRMRAADFHIELDDVSITHLVFSPEYTSAVEAKQVAQQEAERAKFTVERAQQDKRSTIIKAQADAESALMINKAMKENPFFLELRRIEAARDIAHILSRSQNKIYLNSDNLLFNLLTAVGEVEVNYEEKEVDKVRK